MHEITKNSAAIKWGISLILCAVILLIPETDVLTYNVKLYLAFSVFLILSIAFELFNNVMTPSFLYPFLCVVFGVVPASVAYGSWANELVFVFVGAFLMAEVLDDIGLLKRMAYWCLVKFKGSFTKLYLGVFFANLLINTITFCNAYVLLAAFTFGVCSALDLGKSKETAALTIAGLAGCMMGRMFVYAPQTLGLFESSVASILPGFTIPWYQFVFHMSPTIIYLAIFLVIIYKLFGVGKVNLGEISFEEEYKKLGKISTSEKKGAFILALLVVYLLTNPFHGLSTNWGFLLMPMLFFIPGIEIADGNSIKKVNWAMIFFIVACMSIGAIGVNLGLGKIVTDACLPFLSPLSDKIAAYGIVLFGAAANFILTPTAMLTALPASLTELCLALGLDPLVGAYTLIASTDIIFLPYEYVPYLIFFSFGMISTKDFLKMSIVKFILFTICFFVLLVPWWSFLKLL